MKAFEKNIRKVEPYVPGEQPQRKVIKLNTNENPYAPAPGVTKALEEMDTDRLRLYPDPTAAPLVNALADFYHVNPDQVFVGVGSDDVLCCSFCHIAFQYFRQEICRLHQLYCTIKQINVLWKSVGDEV